MNRKSRGAVCLSFCALFLLCVSSASAQAAKTIKQTKQTEILYDPPKTMSGTGTGLSQGQAKVQAVNNVLKAECEKQSPGAEWTWEKATAYTTNGGTDASVTEDGETDESKAARKKAAADRQGGAQLGGVMVRPAESPLPVYGSTFTVKNVEKLVCDWYRLLFITTPREDDAGMLQDPRNLRDPLAGEDLAVASAMTDSEDRDGTMRDSLSSDSAQLDYAGDAQSMYMLIDDSVLGDEAPSVYVGIDAEAN